MSNVVKGNQLMLFKGGFSIAHATSHKFTMTAKSSSVSDKDGGLFATNQVTGLSWEITADHLYTVKEYDSLFDSLIVGDAVDVVFGLPSDYNVSGLVAEDDGPTKGWTAPTTGMYSGKVLITSLATTANAGDNATYSVTFTGTGAINRVTV